MTNFWTVKITTFVLWALATGGTAFWVLQNVPSAAPAVSSVAIQPAVSALATSDKNLTEQVALALGAKNPISPTAASTLSALQARLQLQGVVSVGGQSGAALISVDGKPAKPYRMGSAIEDGLEVTSIKARSVAIGKNGAEGFALELPKQDSGLGLKK